MGVFTKVAKALVSPTKEPRLTKEQFWQGQPYSIWGRSSPDPEFQTLKQKGTRPTAPIDVELGLRLRIHNIRMLLTHDRELQSRVSEAMNGDENGDNTISALELVGITDEQLRSLGMDEYDLDVACGFVNDLELHTDAG